MKMEELRDSLKKTDSKPNYNELAKIHDPEQNARVEVDKSSGLYTVIINGIRIAGVLKSEYEAIEKTL